MEWLIIVLLVWAIHNLLHMLPKWKCQNTPDSLEYNFIFIKSMYIFYVFNIFATHAGF